MTSPRLCECGCRQPTPLATRTRRERGQVAGEPLACILGHNRQRPPTPPIDKFLARVQMFCDDADCTCWHWLGTQSSKWNYPRFYIDQDTGYVLAHRWAYEHYVGPIPDGLTIDHLCRNTLCVNPAHMEPVTNVET